MDLCADRLISEYIRYFITAALKTHRHLEDRELH